LRLREAEVHQLGSGLSQHDVARFQIAMDNALAMRSGKSFGDGDADLENLVHGQCAFAQALGESFSFKKLHDQEIGAILAADVVELTNVGMVQRRDGASLTLHTQLEFRGSGKVRSKNLDGDDTVETRVAGTVDFAHAARAEGADDLVGTELGAGAQGHCSRVIIYR
jgi:hypothetical protein